MVANLKTSIFGDFIYFMDFNFIYFMDFNLDYRYMTLFEIQVCDSNYYM